MLKEVLATGELQLIRTYRCSDPIHLPLVDSTNMATTAVGDYDFGFSGDSVDSDRDHATGNKSAASMEVDGISIRAVMLTVDPFISLPI